MRTKNADSIQNGQYQSSDHVTHHPTFREIYESINYRKDLNGPQLFYLSRLVDRKLKSLDPRLNSDDFAGKPYRR